MISSSPWSYLVGGGGNSFITKAMFDYSSEMGLIIPETLIEGSTLSITGLDSDFTGDRVIVGYPLDTIDGHLNAGRAIVYKKDSTNYAIEAILTLPGTKEQDQFFGRRCYINHAGDRIAISCTGESRNGYTMLGLIYTFTRIGTTWSYELAFGPTNPSNNQVLGLSLAIDASGNTMIAGTNVDKLVEVWWHNGTTWTWVQTITAPATKFGCAIAISGDGNTIAIKSSENNTSIGGNRTSIYKRVSGLFTYKFTLPYNVYSDNTSDSVKLNYDGTRIIIGEYMESNGSPNKGWVCGFVLNDTGITSTMFSLGAVYIENYDNFNIGKSVTISSNGQKMAYSIPGNSYLHAKLRSSINISGFPNDRIDLSIQPININSTDTLFANIVKVSPDGNYLFATTGNSNKVYVYQ